MLGGWRVRDLGPGKSHEKKEKGANKLAEHSDQIISNCCWQRKHRQGMAVFVDASLHATLEHVSEAHITKIC